MIFKTNHIGGAMSPQFFVAFRRLCRTLATVAISSFVALASGQTAGQTSSIPDPQGPAGAVQTPTNPSAAGTNSGSANTATPSSEQPGDDAPAFVFKKEVREVILHATVVDEQRRLVTTLGKGAFTVLEDGALQAITSFHRDDVPIAIGIVIDNSGSMRDKRDKVNQAVLNLIRAGNPKDEIFVVNFSRDPYLDQDYTSDVDLLRQALLKTSTQGTTALYDAIVASVVHLQNNSRVERKVLLVITDGRDNASQATLQDATRRLQQENGPTLYAVGLLGAEGQKPDISALQSLAESTGGVAFFPKDLNEVDDITRTVARDIRSQYTIGYAPTSSKKDSGYRTLGVRAQARNYRKLTVRTRTGYNAGATER
jgi:VWFA-related protein